MPIPTLITVGAGLAGAGLQNATGKNAQKRQHEYSRRLLDYQWQNSVPAMTNSLRKAGLNVGLMYSNGGPSVTGSTGSTSVPQVANPLLGLGDVINQTILTKSASEKNLADANKSRVDALLSDKKLITEELHQQELRLKNANTEVERERILQDIQESKKRIESIDNEIYNRNRETDSKIRLNDSAVLEKDSQTRLNDTLARSEDAFRELRKSILSHDNEIKRSNKVSAFCDSIADAWSSYYLQRYGENPPQNQLQSVISTLKRAIFGSDKESSYLMSLASSDRGILGLLRNIITNDSAELPPSFREWYKSLTR